MKATGKILGAVIFGAFMALNLAAQTTITVYGWDDPSIQNLVNEFNKSQNKVVVDAKILSSPDYETKMGVLMAARQDMDVYFQKTQSRMYMDWANGFIEPLDAYFTKTHADMTAVNNYKDSVTVDGKTLAMPFRGGSYYLYFNKKVFAAAKIPTPDTYVKSGQWTWAKYVEVAKKLSTGDGRVWGTLQYTWSHQSVIPALQKGKQFITQDGKIDLDDSIYSALKMRKDLEDSKAMMKMIDLKVTKLHYSKAFFDGNLGMLIIGEWFPGQLQQADKDGVLKNFGLKDVGITRLPSDLKEYATFGTPTFAHITSWSKKKDAAFAFLAWLGSAEGAKAEANVGLLPPIVTPEVKAILMKTIPDAQSVDYLTEKRKIWPLWMNKYGPQIDQASTKIVDQYLVTGDLNDASLPAAFKNAMQSIIDNSN